MSKTKTWVSAARLRTLPLSISGIIVGTACAFPYYANHANFYLIFFFAIITTLLFQILSNFANDYGDGVKGTDNENRVGPQRALQSGLLTKEELKRGIIFTAGLSLVSALILIYLSFGRDHFFTSLFFFVLGISCVAAAIKYTVGQSAYGYRGLGDLFVFIFFGLVSVMGSFYLYGQTIDPWIILPAVAVGNLSIAVLNINNMRDLDADKMVGKNTLAVKLGRQNAKYYHYFIIAFALVAFVVYAIYSAKPLINFVFVLAYFPFVKHLVFVKNNTNPRELDSQMKIVALSTFLVSVLFSLALIL
ncbi:1,4-dihydroxy-2-naphthoate octaprenyltransferase [Myroides odoratus]|uniref:1,4-dihydroxy-2-naphthoate octaprenyltransferase n=1 Tax=Myroides odoratus TaxID=256 RepID=A0A9Q7EA53_MYROD|nr:1,4-dihydroxy-2-naphthoate octaprenyltransferase [Myroides odoratus]EHQ44366.1 1,4-dihydroxy-2-naphtoate prenyltransferase [Myroides odoratus DSM 2801]EKB03832.1 1,4-dihydroxy-2-naphthoate octaprenyltransferase [Myroides odoratus CIP 103059]QQU01638.1 1,4-dihydroxy-2-naphthoate octaprenyltransferase [Myroides odoratus]WQD56081.1 1,4-dihydroxy-2-naphthoate octaprenyltransferase [Myroides odoratus]STZ31705.1 1,4-dihydroxy-2-naphthoate octaprenyltransferase [Myroides odoratus]